MPLSRILILIALVTLILSRLCVQLLPLHGADGTDFWVGTAKFSVIVQNGMDVQFGSRWFACQFTKALYQMFLQFICQIILLPEEDDAAL